MIVARFKETFRERMPEWILSTGMLLWGMMTLFSPNLFNTVPFFAPLLQLMSQTSWGILAVLIGTIRLIFLIINGAFRPSAHIRAIGCIFGTLLWINLLISALSLDALTPTTAIFAMLLALDIVSLWFAAGDAKLADLAARGELVKA